MRASLRLEAAVDEQQNTGQRQQEEEGSVPREKGEEEGKVNREVRSTARKNVQPLEHRLPSTGVASLPLLLAIGPNKMLAASAAVDGNDCE